VIFPFSFGNFGSVMAIILALSYPSLMVGSYVFGPAVGVGGTKNKNITRIVIRNMLMGRVLPKASDSTKWAVLNVKWVVKVRII
jgi:hypothetical protein